MKIDTKSLLYGTFILTAANLFVRLLGFVYRVFLSRSIGAEGMGLFQLVFPLYLISITITASGVPLAVSRLVSQRKAVNDEKGARKVVLTAALLVSSLSILLSFLLVFQVDWLSTQLLHEPRTRGALFVFFPCIIIIGLGAVLKGYFYGSKDVRPPALGEVVEQLVRMTLVISLLYLLSPLPQEQAAALAVFGMVVGELASLLYLHYRYYRTGKGLVSAHQSPSAGELLKSIILIAIPVTLTRLLSSLMISVNSILIPQRLMAGGMSNHEAIGLFGVFSGMALPLLFLPFTLIGALSVVMIPNISENVVLKNWSDIRSKISKAMLITTLTAFPSMALLLSLGAPIGNLLYNQPLVGYFLLPLSFSLIFHCLQHTLSSVLNGLGKQNRAALHFLAGGLIQMACTYFLVSDPRIGIYGFIIGFFASSILVSMLNLSVVVQITKLKFEFTQWIIKPAFAAALMASTSRFLNLFLRQNGLGPFPAILISFILGLLLFITALIAVDGIPFAEIGTLFSHKAQKTI